MPECDLVSVFLEFRGTQPLLEGDRGAEYLEFLGQLGHSLKAPLDARTEFARRYGCAVSRASFVVQLGRGAMARVPPYQYGRTDTEGTSAGACTPSLERKKEYLQAPVRKTPRVRRQTGPLLAGIRCLVR